MNHKCVVCDDQTDSYGMCEKCRKAYDRWNRTAAGDHISLIIWVADRVRQRERRRQKLKKS